MGDYQLPKTLHPLAFARLAEEKNQRYTQEGRQSLQHSTHLQGRDHRRPARSGKASYEESRIKEKEVKRQRRKRSQVPPISPVQRLISPIPFVTYSVAGR